MFNGLVHLSAWQVALVALGLTHITIISVTVYLHRYSSHRAITLHPALKHFFRFWLWLTTGTSTLEWTAIHRKHHARVDTPDDPHSPVVLGIKKVLWQGAEVYADAAKNEETLKRFGAGCPDDWIEQHLYSRHKTAGIWLMLAIDLLCFGLVGITIWAVQMIWIPFFAAGVINGLGHHAGYRNFECKDASTNIFPWGILIGGEELHNNHHTYPGSAKLSAKWWEIDLGYGYIRLLSWLRLASIRKLPPTPAINPDKSGVDLDTLRALITNRFQVMARYRQQVISPVLQAEKQRAETASQRLMDQARKLLYRDDRFFSDKARARLAALTDNHAVLDAIYQYKQRLQQITSRANQSSQELLAALKQWMEDAEESGIDALRDFANQLQQYVPATAH